MYVCMCMFACMCQLLILTKHLGLPHYDACVLNKSTTHCSQILFKLLRNALTTRGGVHCVKRRKRAVHPRLLHRSGYGLRLYWASFLGRWCSIRSRSSVDINGGDNIYTISWRGSFGG